jgi:two-component system, OmpR family, sensor histidine kinase KdpD
MILARSNPLVLFGLRSLRSLACLAFVAAITWAAFSALHVNALIVGFAYVLAVLVVAARWGLSEALVTSVAAMLCLNYFFLPPILSLTIADPQNWVALFAFFVTAVTASQLSSRARRQTAEARARRAEVEQLYQLSLSLMLVDTTRELGQQIATSVRERFGFGAVAFCDGSTEEIHISGVDNGRFKPEMLRSVAVGNASWYITRRRLTLVDNELIVAPVALGGHILGSLGAIGPSLSEPAVQAIANLAAVALEHARQQISFGRVEVARQNERLRGILLDALAHDFLTPLTSIKSAISTVRSEYQHDAEENEFLSVAEEESDKLSEMVNEATDMARIEPGKPRIRRREVRVQDVIQSSLKRMKTMTDGRPVETRIAEGIPSVNADPEMMGLALRQLLGNAVKFSPPETAIAISASQSGDMVIFEVRDHGPGIAQEERELIFERFYRGRQVAEQIAGTGMGLSIARDIIGAHHGRLWVENDPEGGARFSFTVPVFHQDRKS